MNNKTKNTQTDTDQASEKLTEDNIQFTIYKKSIIKIPIYNSELKTDFINLKIL